MTKIFSVLLGGLLLAGSIQALPTPAQSNAEKNTDWKFALYQNEKCTGVASPYSGSGSTGCKKGILNGSALAYIKTATKSDCTVSLFGDDECKHKIGAMNTNTKATCSALHGKQISSFAVKC